MPEGEISLLRRVERFPYVPSDPAARDERCYEAYNIQVHGLMKRLQSAGIEQIVIGVSGRTGFDSGAHRRGQDYGSSRTAAPEHPRLHDARFRHERHTTLANAHGLMRALGVTASEIDIRPSCLQMLRDIGHPFAQGERVYDVDIRERAGRRAHLAFIPSGQSAQRDGARDGRFERTGARLDAPTAWATTCRTTT